MLHTEISAPGHEVQSIPQGDAHSTSACLRCLWRCSQQQSSAMIKQLLALNQPSLDIGPNQSQHTIDTHSDDLPIGCPWDSIHEPLPRLGVPSGEHGAMDDEQFQ